MVIGIDFVVPWHCQHPKIRLSNVFEYLLNLELTATSLYCSFIGTNGYCNGTKQSPINLPYINDVIIRKDWLPFQLIHYDTDPYKMFIENNGHTVKVTYDAASCSHIPMITQGGLPGKIPQYSIIGS